MGERDLYDKICTTRFVDHNLKTEFVCHNLVQKTKFVRNSLRFAKQTTKENSVKNLKTELELFTEFVSHNLQCRAQNRICKQQFEVCKANNKKPAFRI